MGLYTNRRQIRLLKERISYQDEQHLALKMDHQALQMRFERLVGRLSGLSGYDLEGEFLTRLPGRKDAAPFCPGQREPSASPTAESSRVLQQAANRPSSAQVNHP